MSEIPSVHEFDRGEAPVIARVCDHPPGFVSDTHRHPTAQLLCAAEGVMVAMTERGQWIVPPTRGVWLPIGTRHSIRTVTAVKMRNIFIRADTLHGDLPRDCRVIAISPLLRELISAAAGIHHPYDENGRDGRVMRLILDEIRSLPELPLALPMPPSPDLRAMCEEVRADPGDNSSADARAAALGVDVRTLERRMVRETGLTLGRWRRQARLVASLERLALGDKIIDVALEMGYESPTAFSTMFRRELGAAPSDFFSRRDD